MFFRIEFHQLRTQCIYATLPQNNEMHMKLKFNRFRQMKLKEYEKLVLMFAKLLSAAPRRRSFRHIEYTQLISLNHNKQIKIRKITDKEKIATVCLMGMCN